MARARAEASNQAYLMAQQQALAEQGQQAQMATNYGRLANQYNQTQYLPMQTQMQLMQLAGADADRSQTGQLTGQGYIGQMALGGMQTEVNALKKPHQSYAAMSLIRYWTILAVRVACSASSTTSKE